MDNKEKTRIILPFIVLAICVPIIVDFLFLGILSLPILVMKVGQVFWEVF